MLGSVAADVEIATASCLSREQCIFSLRHEMLCVDEVIEIIHALIKGPFLLIQRRHDANKPPNDVGV